MKHFYILKYCILTGLCDEAESFYSALFGMVSHFLFSFRTATTKYND